ncbi:MAG: nicotinate (nicotinamide) nucleotide adenylyltransferase [Eubacterium sp.]|nr:nicotinate (nicotinamide) nucleotide adenylyltransferase [Eubacterium sp.]
MDKDSYYDISNTGDIAILGGSFNPIHIGHIGMAESAYRLLGLDIVLMPNKTTYYKENKTFAPDKDRLEMLRQVADKYSYIYYSDMEIVRGGVTHTIDTIEEFKKVNPDRKIYFIIGGDSLEWVDKWVDAEKLLSDVTFLTAVRGETDKVRTTEIVERLKKEYPQSKVLMLDMFDIPISSSDIRELLGRGEDVTGLVPDYIRDYILEKNLYGGSNG